MPSYESRKILPKLASERPNMNRLFFFVLLASVVVFLGMEIESAYADSNAAAMTYRSNVSPADTNIPRYVEWDPASLAWGSEVDLTSAGSPVRFAWLEFSPISAKRVIVTLSDDGFLDSYVCDNACTTSSSWTVTNDIVDLWTTAPTGAQRPFDMAFENTSGDLILVYDKVSSSSTQDLFYRVMSSTATSFGSESTIDDTTAAATDTVYSFVRMATKFSSGSDSIGMIALDETGVDAIAFIWNGSSWGSEHELTATASIGTEEVIGVAWERSSGDLIIVAGEGTNMRYNEFTTSWGTSATFATWAVGTINFVTLKANPVSSSNEMFVAAVGSLNDLDSAYWSGSAWTDHTEHDAAVDSNAARIMDFSWNGNNSEGVLIWGTAAGSVTFNRFTASNTWAGQSTFTETGTHLWVQLADPPNPTTGDTVSALGATLDSTFDIGGIRWDGGTNNPVSTTDGGITTDTVVSTYEAFSVDWQRSKAISRTFTETLTTTDARNGGYTKPVSETLTLTDALALVKAFNKALAETLTTLDTLANTYTKSLTETLSLSDTLTTTAQFIRSLNESLAFADTNVRTYTRKLDESLSLSDALTTAQGKNLSETLGLSDTVATTSSIAKNLSETLTVSDVIIATGDVTKDLSETLNLSDTMNARITIKSLQETLTVSDTVTTIGGVLKNLAESLSLSDTMNARITIKNLQETLGLSEGLSVFSSNIVSLSETVGLGDTVTTMGIANNNRVEAFGISDSIGLTTSTPTPPPSPIPVTVNSLGGTGIIGGINMTFPNISTAGVVTVTMLNVNDEPPIPPELTLVPWMGSIGLVDIDTTATFTGFIQIAVGYDDTGIEFEETAITLIHFNGINWEDITTSVDTDNNIVYGQTDSLSPFGVAVNPSKLGGGSGGGGPAYEIIDTVPPEIVSQHYEPTTPFSGQELRVLAKINDDVQITKAYLLYFVNTPEPEFHQVSMLKHNAEYYMGTIPASDVRIVGMTYWIFAEDFGGNNAQSAVQNVEIKQSTQAVIPPKPSQKNLPSHVLEAIKPKIVEPVGKLEILSMNSGSEINTFTDTIIIRNTGNKTADNIRIMLSPEISKSFKLSDLSIKSIEPNANVTITLQVNGNPNRDMLGGLLGYTGNVIVMAEHVSPITLPVNIGSEESTYKDEYMDKVAAMAEQRYSKISLLNSILTKQDKIEHNYEVTTSDGGSVITNPSDEIVIRNLSEKQLKNVRIYLNNAGNAFLLEHKNIQTLEPNGQVSIKLISKMDSNKYSPRDIKGELLIVPANDVPIVIPIDIVGQERKDSADEFEIRTLLGNDGIFTAHDKIVIKNLGNRTLDSVRLMLPVDLARVFTLSNDSFKNIAPKSEVTVDLKFRDELGEHKMGIQYNYQGELTIVSEHHRAKVIPINVTWNEISSEHFLIYSRNSESDIAKAKDLITFLESKYQNVTSRFGEMEAKTKIYMTNTLEEFRLIADSGHSYYAFSDDVIFMCGCDEDVKSLAMKEFVYKITFNKYPNYSNKEKFMLDGKNWLMDGITNYVAANITGEQGMVSDQLEAFKAKPTSFVWYGSADLEQYGAAYTFFQYLQEKYGSDVIDSTLHYLGSSMVSNHRCDTLEDCAVLRAVYDVSGLDMKEKRNLDVDMLVKEWEDYVLKNYSVTIQEQGQIS